MGSSGSGTASTVRTQTRLDDDDEDGVPDFVATALETTEGALELYESLGFRLPLGDGGAGGSEAFDAYLVDFDGLGDGAFTPESCTTVGSATQCAGYFAMENDFTGYGYPSVDYAIETVAPHELFHAVQAAYDADEGSWWSEGTATWAEQLYVPGSTDFLAFCDYYLSDPGRTLDSPPSGPVPAWSYGTAIWWWYLADAHGTGILGEMLEASEAGDDLLVDMAVLIEAHGSTLEDDWIEFTGWNLATDDRAGATDSYPFADDIGPVGAEEETDALVLLHRFYPLGATYFPIDHAGGHLWLATDADAPSVVFSVHPTNGDGQVEPSIGSWTAGPSPQDLGEQAAGLYWLVGANPTLDEDSTHVTVCFGSAETVSACAPKDTGGTDSGGDDGSSAPDGDSEDDGGCGCGGGTSGSLFAALVVATLLPPGGGRPPLSLRRVPLLEHLGADEPPQERARRERRHDRHQHEHGEERRRDHAEVEPDVEHDELHQPARVHQDPDRGRCSTVHPDQPRGHSRAADLADASRRR